MRSLTITAFLAGLVTAVMSGLAPAMAATPDQCQALASHDFGTVPDAPTRVVTSTAVPASPQIPAFCKVEGYVAPQVGFEFHLPMNGWNGKFVMQGCGAMCGEMMGIASCPEAVARGYACGTTDMGHRAPMMDGKWAYANPVAEIDAGHRGTHVATLAGKAITEAFYAASIKRSYFRGCSTGGRQALVEAQRYAYDFDGIVAGASVLYTPMGPPLHLFWNSTANLDSAGKPILTMAKLTMLHKAVLDACDATDGLKDGAIADPRMCKFDPAQLACRAGNGDSCLNEAELGVVRKFYGGPRNSKGPMPRISGQQFGTELGWAGSLNPSTANYSFANENLRYLAFALDPGPTYDVKQFDWERDPQRLSYTEFSAGNPDLGLFADHGGKLIMFHGWGDPAIPATTSIGYYEMMARTMGGLAATQKFARLFLLPGMGHCAGGEGVNAADMLGAIDAWVENGKAPDMIPAYSVGVATVGPVLAPAGFTGDNMSVANPKYARPLFPYPDEARYNSGDQTSLASFKRVRGPGDIK